MLTLFGNLESGNVHKAQLILKRVGAPYRRVDVAQTRGEPRSREFLAINPMGKVPALILEDGDVLSESGAILYHFGRSGRLWPDDLRGQTEVLRWMFFEQYSHEPALAVSRYLLHFSTDGDAAGRVRALLPKARAALGVMERRLETHDWLACDYCTLADYALYPYSRMMNEASIDAADYPAVGRWLGRCEKQPRFLLPGQDGAAESMSFREYFGGRAK